MILLHTNPTISSNLTKFMPGQIIESIIILSVPDSNSVLIDGTVLECATSSNSVSEIIASDFSPGIYLSFISAINFKIIF